MPGVRVGFCDDDHWRLNPLKSVTLQAGSATAEIALLGAEVRRWMIGRRPMLWDPSRLWMPSGAVWKETAPILFPVVGWTRNGSVRVGEKRFPLGLHGFARVSEFTISARTPSSVQFQLRSSATTRALYPFDFRLSVEYQLEVSHLATVLTVTNCGDGPMPYACGLHPGFRWPFAGDEMADYALVFERAEDHWVPEISKAGLFLPTKRHVGLEGTRVPLTPDLFAKEALCFLDAKSRSVRFENNRSGTALVVAGEDFPHLAFWARPPARFLSIETWTGHGDPEGFDGDLFEKPGMRVLAPGAQARHAAHYTYQATVAADLMPIWLPKRFRLLAKSAMRRAAKRQGD
jgi:galactose mutarotase-like enzyme